MMGTFFFAPRCLVLEITEPALFEGAILQFQGDLRRPSYLAFGARCPRRPRLVKFCGPSFRRDNHLRFRFFDFAHDIKSIRNPDGVFKRVAQGS